MIRLVCSELDCFAVTRIGDRVTVCVCYCERHGQEGEVIAVSTRRYDSMPFTVQFSDYWRWPFAASELINDTAENEEFEREKAKAK